MLRGEKVRDVIKPFGPKIMKTKRSSQKSFFFTCRLGLSQLFCTNLVILFTGPSHHPVFAVCKIGGGNPGPFYHVNNVSVYLRRGRGHPLIERAVSAPNGGVSNGRWEGLGTRPAIYPTHAPVTMATYLLLSLFSGIA